MHMSRMSISMLQPNGFFNPIGNIFLPYNPKSAALILLQSMDVLFHHSKMMHLTGLVLFIQSLKEEFLPLFNTFSI
jgi:hypothetical protein